MTDDWRADSECLKLAREIGMDYADAVFFPIVKGRTKRSVWDDARQVCGRCPVLDECLDDVMGRELTTGRHGFCGGMDPRERDREGYRRRRAAA